MIDLDQELDKSSLEPLPLPSFEEKASKVTREEVLSKAPLQKAPNEPPIPMGLDDVFEEFKQDIDEDLGDSDYETHYSLGIAFREMGLLEEAIAEFQKAMQNK